MKEELKKEYKNMSTLEKLIAGALVLFGIKKGFEIAQSVIVWGFLAIVFILAIIWLYAN